MARTKQATPIRREPSSEYISKHVTAKDEAAMATIHGTTAAKRAAPAKQSGKAAGIKTLVIDVAGIYISFLTWAYLQEKLTTTVYGAGERGQQAGERFTFPVFLLTVQSVFSAVGGQLFSAAAARARGEARPPPMIPSRAMLPPLMLVALTNALAAPFGYAALAHIDYVTYTLAKSCKLVPIMALHVTLFRRRYPLYKYAVVAAVTAGVAVFTLHSGSSSAKKRHGANDNTNIGQQPAWGLLLLGINLLFDGLTNSTQDYIFTTFRPYSGPQMMVANNLLSSALTASYLLLGPWLAATPLGAWLGVDAVGAGEGELAAALAFLRRHPAVWRDVLGFALCGCVGQVFIFHTLSTFSSVLLVTVTVTRKMFTMILSVVAFGHRLSHMQWLGVGLVFGGIGVEAGIARQEKMAKETAKAAESLARKQDGGEKEDQKKKL